VADKSTPYKKSKKYTEFLLSFPSEEEVKGKEE
jgi:hypothetical protein